MAGTCVCDVQMTRLEPVLEGINACCVIRRQIRLFALPHCWRATPS